MKAAQIHKYGPPDVIVYEDVHQPQPGEGQALIRVKAAGVGNWDALIREGKIGLPQPLPLILGAELSGIVESVGPEVADFHVGDEMYGVTNEQFIGAYAEYAIVDTKRIAPKPSTLEYIQAASVPIVAVTAWQMLFDYGDFSAGKTVLIHGAAGNVGAYAVQLAKQSGGCVIGTASSRDIDYLRSLGAEQVIDYHSKRFDDVVKNVDIVIDTVGGEIQDRSYGVLKPGGVLVTSVSNPKPSQKIADQYGVQAIFFIVDVTTDRLKKITQLVDCGKLKTDVGEVLPLAEARIAHEMLAGVPHKRGKIVLRLAD